MAKLRRFTLSDQLVEALRHDILAGRWPDPLPGCLKLGAVYGVSGPTLAAALARLAELGIITSGGPRRPFRRAAAASAPATSLRPSAKPTLAKILIVGSRPLEQLDAWDRLLINILNRELSLQAAASYLQLNLHAREANPRRWEIIVSQHQPDLLVPLSAGPAFLAWALSKGINTLPLGGHVPVGRLALYGPRTFALLLRARQLLAEQGHRHIAAVVFNLFGSAKPDSLLGKLAPDIQRPVREMISSGELVHHTADTPGRRREILAEILSSRRPTGLVLYEWSDYLLAFSLAASLGLRVPKDLSLIVLSESADLPFLVPRPAHLHIPHALYTDLIARRLRGEKVNPADFAARCESCWDLGGSVGPPPADLSDKITYRGDR